MNSGEFLAVALALKSIVENSPAREKIVADFRAHAAQATALTAGHAGTQGRAELVKALDLLLDQLQS